MIGSRADQRQVPCGVAADDRGDAGGGERGPLEVAKGGQAAHGERGARLGGTRPGGGRCSAIGPSARRGVGIRDIGKGRGPRNGEHLDLPRSQDARAARVERRVLGQL